MIAKQYLELAKTLTESVHEAVTHQNMNAAVNSCRMLLAIAFPGNDRQTLQQYYEAIITKMNEITEEVRQEALEPSAEAKAIQKKCAALLPPLLYSFLDVFYTLLHARDAFLDDKTVV